MARSRPRAYSASASAPWATEAGATSNPRLSALLWVAGQRVDPRQRQGGRGAACHQILASAVQTVACTGRATIMVKPTAPEWQEAGPLPPKRQPDLCPEETAGPLPEETKAPTARRPGMNGRLARANVLAKTGLFALFTMLGMTESNW